VTDRRALRWNGWGPVDQPDPLTGRPGFWALVADAVGATTLPETPAQELETVRLPPPLAAPHLRRLEELLGSEAVLTDRRERAARARGRSYPDLVALRAGDATSAPAAVVLPATTEQVLALLSFAAETGSPVVPIGGGTSVVGGVSGPPWPWIAVDTARMSSVLEVDEVNRTATAGAGIDGPALEAALNERGYTLGHFPQSFRHSTLGGWIAASGAGQQSNRYGRAADWMLRATVATPSGAWRTEAFPWSAAGPRLGSLLVGSEGVLGILTEATVRIRRLPEVRDYRGYIFPDFASGAAAVRSAVQNDCRPAMLRLLDPAETRFLGAVERLGRSPSLTSRVFARVVIARGAGATPCLLIGGFEGGKEEAERSRRDTERHIRREGGIPVGARPGRSWYASRFDLPALRDVLLARGVGVDTVETAGPWSDLSHLKASIGSALERAIAEEAPGRHGLVLAHLSHSYPEGAALYFTFVFPQRLGDEIEQWRRIKQAVSETIVSAGGTITHHHGIGEDHRPWLAAEKGDVGIELLRALKATLDPSGVLNPGTLLPDRVEDR
jgi:alkyldihydroxyacetonephosphate synthase